MRQIVIGINIPKKDKKITSIIAGSVYGVTDVFLMTKVFKIAKEMMEQKENDEIA